MTPVAPPDAPARTARPQDATRREFITGAGAVAFAAAFLAACGGREVAATPETREEIDFTYEDITTTVPSRPERVVVMEGRGDLDFALSVGYPIVATGTWDASSGKLPGGPFAGLLEGAEVLPDMYTTRDYETLVRLQPDLIVQRANAFRGDFYGNDRLADIAPVLSIECNRANWRADLEAQARLLGRDQAVGEQLAAYDAAVAAAKAQIRDVVSGRRVALITATPESFLVWTSNFATEVANDIGLPLPFRNSSEGDGSYIDLPAEQWGRLAEVDLIFGQNFEANRDVLAEIATWTGLPAVEAGHVVDFPGELNNGMALTAKTLAGFLAEGVRIFA